MKRRPENLSVGFMEAQPDVLVALYCLFASTGGLVYGFSIGFAGVSAMDSFQYSFFSSGVTTDVSVQYLAGLIACLPASFMIQGYGKRASIVLGGLSFTAGVLLTGGAQSLAMFMLGRVMLGVGSAFGNQAIPVYLSEVSPPEDRGMLGCTFQMMVALGTWCACLGNYVICTTGSLSSPDSWRILFGLAGAPALLMTASALLIPETPHDLIQRRCHQLEEQGRHQLEEQRHHQQLGLEVHSEFHRNREVCKGVGRTPGFKNLLRRESIPPLVMAVLVPFFQQFTGINGVIMYANLLCLRGKCSGIPQGVLIPTMSLAGTVLSMMDIDDWGRRFFFLEAGFQMFLSLVALALVNSGGGKFPQVDKLSVTLLCVYVCGCAQSWGPLGWIIPSEIFPKETRTAGQAVAAASNILFTLVILEIFPTMVGKHNYGVFMFFAIWVLAMTAFVYWFLPETKGEKGLPLEDVTRAHALWRKHWFWKRFYDKGNLNG